MPAAEREAYNREKLAGASRDADAWLDDQVRKLQGLTDVHQFHKQWDFIIKRGRRAANVGRFFRDEHGKGPLTIEAELEGWAAYQETKARATDAGRAGWEPLPSTVGETIPRWVVETVLDHVTKEQRACGHAVRSWNAIVCAG